MQTDLAQPLYFVRKESLQTESTKYIWGHEDFFPSLRCLLATKDHITLLVLEAWKMIAAAAAADVEEEEEEYTTPHTAKESIMRPLGRID